MALLSHLRMVISGTIQSSQSWSTGVGIAGADEALPDAQTMDQLLGEYVTFVNTWWAAGVGHINSVDVRATRLTLTSYASGSTKAVTIREKPLDLTGLVVSTVPLPVFTAMVQSLVTSTPGRSGRGRMYLPSTQGPLDGTHQFPNNSCTTNADATAALLRGIAAVLPVRFFAAVCGKAGNFPINEVRVDSLPDTQHRREDKLGAIFRASAVV